LAGFPAAIFKGANLGKSDLNENESKNQNNEIKVHFQQNILSEISKM
jgi:hypothetical protein